MIDNSVAYLDEIAIQIRKCESGRQAITPSTQTQFKVIIILLQGLNLITDLQVKIDTQRSVSLSPVEEIIQLVKSAPSETIEKLPWLLNVVGKTIRYCV